ncbi:putative membrane protein [Propionispora sp. 2/2-37]|uniref:hypothetical protein n=1 Tax=Propionispora sp. 2/2-37 TaxID=1677858 RepID=UPI0006BB6895|nr:hypothetical protein [Propionispora sp. 2/2-37]CUH96512.1 putative membrane protein [Propionispora sp. 2/2-37]
MRLHWKSFTAGSLMMFVLFYGLFLYPGHFPGQSTAGLPPATEQSANANGPDIPNAVTVIPLPSLRILSGNHVAFEGTAAFTQSLNGRFAKNLSIIAFEADGEHADKSMIKIVWENGETDMIPPGSKNKTFAPERRAISITVVGYSMHERRIFKDSSRPGTLTWEIHYEPVE